jgi:hypothetical protein
MVFCTGCGNSLHETAPLCPRCGMSRSHVAGYDPIDRNGPLWAAITSLVLGVLAALSLFDDADWDQATEAGVALASIAGLVFGIVSLNLSKRGKGMAIAGVVTSAIGFLCVIGSS